MKYIKTLLFLSSLSAIVCFCGTYDNKHTENITSKVSFEIIKTGILHGAGEEGFSQEAIKVSNIEEFNQILKKLNSVNEELGDDIISNESFFDEQMLVFVFDKVRGTGGYDFNVEHVLLQSDTIAITAFSKKPEGPATSIMTQPFQLLQMDKLNSAVQLMLIE